MDYTPTSHYLKEGMLLSYKYDYIDAKIIVLKIEKDSITFLTQGGIDTASKIILDTQLSYKNGILRKK
jgi:hypothetical protein